MKFCSQLLVALCVFQRGATAFSIAPKALTRTGKNSRTASSLSPLFTYSGDLNSNARARVPMSEADRVFNRNSDRDRVFDRIPDTVPMSEFDRVFNRNPDRDRDFDRFPDTVPMSEADRVFNRNPDRDRVFERTPDRFSDRDFERNPDRDFERNPDRVYDRTPDRDFDRIPDRVYDRNPDRDFDRSPERNPDRSPDRVYERTPGRVYDRNPDRIPNRVYERTPDDYIPDQELGGSIAMANDPRLRTPPARSVSTYRNANQQFAQNIGTLQPVKVQGGTLKTWSFSKPEVERLLVYMESPLIDWQNGSGRQSSLQQVAHEGRLMKARIDLCQGPDNTPLRMEVTSEKGHLRPFSCVIETPGGHSSLFIRNIGDMEFPISAGVAAAAEDNYGGRSEDLMEVSKDIFQMRDPQIVQGNAVVTFPLPHAVSSAKVVLRTDGRPLNAQVELVQGPNAPKVTIDLYTENGIDRPFCTVIPTPGAENVIRVINTAPIEFPMTVCVEPFD